MTSADEGPCLKRGQRVAREATPVRPGEAILPEVRNSGGLSDQVLTGPQVLRATLVEWGGEIEALTPTLNYADPDDTKALGADVTASSHG